MTDNSRRDVSLGDLSSLDPASTATSGPGMSSVDGMAVTRSQPALRVGREPADSVRQSLLVLTLAVLVVLLLGIVIYLVVSQRELATALAVLEEKSRESVASLAGQMSSTTTTLHSSDSQTQKSLNLLAGDLARLNAAIDRLGKALDAQAREQTATAAGVKAVDAEWQRVSRAAQQDDAQRDARSKALADGLDGLAAKQKALADSLARLERSGDAAQLRADVAMLGADLREIRDDYDKRLKAGEQATASSDAFRRQVNATIERLNQQVAELYQRR